jgi:hypothetical protein
MSLENPQIVEPSCLKPSEGCQGWAMVNPVENGRDQNDGLSSQRHDVVCGGGMPDKVGVLMEEICPSGRQGPTAGASGKTVSPVRLGQKSERPIVGRRRLTPVDRRGRA